MPIANRNTRVCLGIAALFGCCHAACAADPFRVTATVGTQSGSVGLATAQQLFDQLSRPNLQALAPNYTENSVASVDIDFRGLAVRMEFPVASSSLLVFSIPSLGNLSRSVQGATREDSRQQLRELFKREDLLGQIMKALAQSSPIDPIAGNPASLQSRMVAGEFDRNFRGLAAELAARALGNETIAQAQHPVWLAAAGDELPALPPSAGEPGRRAGVMLEADIARYSRAGLSSVVATLPFSYSFATSAERPLSLDGSLMYAETAGAKSYGLNLGLAYRARMQERWYLVPSAGVGYSESKNLGSAGAIASATLTSALRLYQSADYALWMGNAISLQRTLSITRSGYTFDPKLQNTVFTNGLLLSATPSPLWKNYWLEYSFADTRYTGSNLYDERYDELGVAIARTLKSGWGTTTLRAVLSYLDTTHSRGVMLKLQATF